MILRLLLGLSYQEIPNSKTHNGEKYELPPLRALLVQKTDLDLNDKCSEIWGVLGIPQERKRNLNKKRGRTRN